MDFSNFKPYAIVSGLPTVSITKNGMTFSKTALIKMGKPDYIKLMINEDEKQLAFFAANEDEDNVIKCMVDKNKKEAVNFRINARDLLYKIASLMGCKFEELNFKVIGELFNEDKVMLLDLNRATKINESDASDDE